MAMRRLLLPLALVLGAVAVGPAVSASASAGHHGQVAGTGTLGQFGDPTAHVNAIQTAAGLKGEFNITYPDGTFAAGPATCLAIAGTTAYVTARITRSGGPRQPALNWLPGGFLVIGVQDNGEPGTAGPDRLNFSPGFAADPGCGPNLAAAPVFAITAGNYRVFAPG
jgi:hypothetical protein